MEIDLLNFFIYFDKENPNHVKAVREFSTALSKKAPEELTNKTGWVLTYRTPVVKPQPKKEVKWYPQTDNYTQPDRTCNSSCCAMCLEYYLPGSLPPGPKGDDIYLKKVLSLGDSTDHNVQTKALASYGLDSTWKTNLTFDDLNQHLENVGPIVAGILHRGPNNNPTRNSGHMIVIHTKLPNGNYVCNDPYGSLNKGYSTPVEDGKNVVYERAVLEKRWTADGNKSGWGRTFSPKKPQAENSTDTSQLVNKSQLSRIWNCNESLVEDSEVAELNRCIRQFDITTPNRIINIMTPFSSLREAIATLREKPRELWKLAKPGRMRSRPSRVSIVHIDDFGGTSVNPSQVFRTARGRADLDAMASLAEKLKISIPERASKSRSD